VLLPRAASPASSPLRSTRRPTDGRVRKT
jgi:hypothetical protein